MQKLGVALLLIFRWFDSAAIGDDEAASLIRALCANSEAVRQFDVLIEQEVAHNIPDVAIDREVAFVRIRADRDVNRILSATYRRKMEEGVPGDGAKGPSLNVRLCGVQWDGESGHFLEVPNQIETVSSYVEILRDQNVPDLRCVGLDPYPQPFLVTGSSGGFNNWRNTRLTTPILSSTGADRQMINVVFRPVSNRGDGVDLVQNWIFDLEKLVPIRLERKFIAPDGEEKKAHPIEMQAIEWEKKRGLYVPTRIVGDKVARRKGVRYAIETTVYFHWVSVNEPIGAEEFESKLIETDSALIQLTDPKANGIAAHIQR